MEMLMSDAQDEVFAMQGREVRKPLPVPEIANSALSSAAALFRRIEAQPQDEWIVGDAGPYGAFTPPPSAPVTERVPSELLARRELAARLDGGIAMDDGA